MEKVMKITGRGRAIYTPDTTVINLSFESITDEYEEAVKKSAEDVMKIKEMLSTLNISVSQLKTTQYSVNTYYVSYKDQNNNYKQRFAGYKYSQSLRFSFKNDNKLLGKVLYKLSKLDNNPKFDISFEVSDTENAKNILLKNAIKDAMNKAKIISEASNVKLGEIITIDYSFMDINFRRSSRMEMITYDCMCASEGFDIDIEPEDINVEDNVTITYSIA